MGQIVPYKDKIKALQTLLNNRTDALSQLLPRGVSADRLKRTAISCVAENPKLAECTAASFVGACLKAAQCGVELGGAIGEAYLVPYGNKATFMLGYKGLIKMAANGGEIRKISAFEVMEGDHFAYELGLNERLEHRPCCDRGEILYFYAIATFKDGSKQFEVMSKSQVDEIRARSRSSSSGPWKTDYVMMGRKTVIRRLCKYLPLATEVLDHILREEQVELGIQRPETLNAEVDEQVFEEAEFEEAQVE